MRLTEELMRVWVRGEGTRSADGPCINDTVGFLVSMPHKNSGKVHLMVINLSEARQTGRILLESQLHLCELQRH